MEGHGQADPDNEDNDPEDVGEVHVVISCLTGVLLRRAIISSAR